MQRSFALPEDAFSLAVPGPGDEANLPTALHSTLEESEVDLGTIEPGNQVEPPKERPIQSLSGDEVRVVELVVRLTAEEFEELMRLARQRTREA